MVNTGVSRQASHTAQPGLGVGAGRGVIAKEPQGQLHSLPTHLGNKPQSPGEKTVGFAEMLDKGSPPSMPKSHRAFFALPAS